MVYIILNVILSLSLIFFTHQVNKKIREQVINTFSLSVALLFNSIASVLFTVLMIVKEFGHVVFVGVSMRLVLLLEGIALIILSFSLIELGCKRKHAFANIVKYILFVSVIYISFFRISYVELSPQYGLMIDSNFIFKGYLRNFLPIRWYDLYVVLTKFIVPIVGFLYLVLLQEHNSATQLERYQTSIVGSAFLVMWIIYLVLMFIATKALLISYLYMFCYAYMYIVIYMGFTKTNVPSGRAILVSIFKVLVSYILPASIVGILCAYFQPVVNSPMTAFIIAFTIFGGVLIIFAINSSLFLSSSTKLYTADYEAGLEKDLASIEYREADMDAITARMYEILNKNAETSSLNVYILSNPSELTTAYSSNNLNQIILTNNVIFDVLLNINKNIVVYSEIEKEHSLATIQEDLKDFFDYTESDALFILNEGHNIFGIITLGKKITGDHYKSYDYNVFEKLYSYFFVFGYYMRNIANKDIIGIVNREIRMSSQIITSIQENVDKVKSLKVDVGYLMVPAHNIGGEFIDLIRLTDTRHLFVVGDLSGKGIGASMSMVILKSIIRTHLAEIHDFKELVVRLNRFIRDSLPKGTIFAGLFALIDFETDTMYYINCGIPALLMYTQVYNNVIEIQGSGHILGFVKDISPYISVKTTKLNHGDILLACTEGLVESHSLRGESFGKERIQQSILDNSSYTAQRMAQFTFDSLVKFMSREMEDDVSILVIKYQGSANDKTSDKESKTALVENVETVNVMKDIPDSNSSIVKESEPAPVKSSENNKSPDISNPDTGNDNAASANAESSSPSIPEFFVSDGGGENMPDLSDLDELLKEAGL